MARLGEVANQLSASTGVPMTFAAEEIVQSHYAAPLCGTPLPRYDRQIAEIYNVPPWMVDPVYDTARDRMWWRLRYVRRAWRWCKRLADY